MSIGHLVRKHRKELIEWEPVTDGKVYARYSLIPKVTCEICARKAPPSRSYDVSVKLYRHHILPKELWGKEQDINTRRDKYCVCCGACHALIHNKIDDLKAIIGRPLREDEYYEAIKWAYRIKNWPRNTWHKPKIEVVARDEDELELPDKD